MCIRDRIGILRWCVELGRIDICTEASMMAAFSAALRIGHLGAVFHMYSYLKWHQRSRLVFDSAYNKEIKIREKPDWSPFYGDLQEEDPPGMPKPRGKPVSSSPMKTVAMQGTQ